MSKTHKQFIYLISTIFLLTSTILIICLATRVLLELNENFYVHKQQNYNAVGKTITNEIGYTLIGKYFRSLLGRSLPLTINHPKHSGRQHARMIPTPYVMYAPAPGEFEFYTHNNQQFRYRADLKKKKQPGEYRIFIIGGSTAWGSWAESNEETIAAHLEKILRSRNLAPLIKVVTAGVGGYTTTDELIWTLVRVSQYSPDVVISYSGFNDVFNVHQKKQDVLSNLHNESLYYFWAINEYDRFNRGDLGYQGYQNFGGTLWEEEGELGKTIANIKNISEIVKGFGAKYIYVFQPVSKQFKYSEDENSRMDMELAAESISLASSTNDYLFINHLSIFEDRNELFFDEVHLTSEGNQEVASRLAKVIERIPIVQATSIDKAGD
jgi:lysophospholipase L1-like esterase